MHLPPTPAAGALKQDDRRAIGALLGRAQDCEVDQIDRRVGFEHVAPDALAGMRFAGNQQHPQAVAHPVDDDDGAVVNQGQLARAGRRFELQHIGAAMVDRDRQRDIAADPLFRDVLGP